MIILPKNNNGGHYQTWCYMAVCTTPQKDFARQGKDVKIYVSAYVSVNGRPFKQLINPEIDLASVPWETFKHGDWILPSEL